MGKRTVFYCGIPIEYNLTRKPVKNINLRINQYGEILVSARRSISAEQINEFVESKAEWIIRTLAEIERYNIVKPDNDVYMGKKVYFLGSSYNINVCHGEEKVVLKDSLINIYTMETENSQKLKEIYIAWLYERAGVIFKDVLERMYSLVERENIPYPTFIIKNMKSRWGSCRPSAKSITLNLQLIKTDMECIEQVVVHELLHFKQANHSKNFYTLVEKYIPDWRERKRRTENKYKDGI